MIGKLTGTLERSEGGSIIVEVGGVGYLVRVPLATLALMPGSLVSLHVHTAVREDAIDLYGFETAEELAFFKQLTSVAGVGPKTALGVLNVADVASLTRSIAAGDASALTKVFGIGKKSAERIVVELKDKIVHTSPSTPLGATSSNDVEIGMPVEMVIRKMPEPISTIFSASSLPSSSRFMPISEIVMPALLAFETASRVSCSGLSPRLCPLSTTGPGHGAVRFTTAFLPVSLSLSALREPRANPRSENLSTNF